MSQQEKSMKGQIVCLLPELVSNLQKDLYFYAPEKTVTWAENDVQFAHLPQIEFPKWDSFEFITKKKGATGPTKFECLDYYQEK